MLVSQGQRSTRGGAASCLVQSKKSSGGRLVHAVHFIFVQVSVQDGTEILRLIRESGKLRESHSRGANVRTKFRSDLSAFDGRHGSI